MHLLQISLPSLAALVLAQRLLLAINSEHNIYIEWERNKARKRLHFLNESGKERKKSAERK